MGFQIINWEKVGPHWKWNQKLWVSYKKKCSMNLYTWAGKYHRRSVDAYVITVVLFEQFPLSSWISKLLHFPLCVYREQLKAEAFAREKKANPANFGVRCHHHCMCEIPGQVPCPGWVPLPKELRGKHRLYGKDVQEWHCTPVHDTINRGWFRNCCESCSFWWTHTNRVW